MSLFQFLIWIGWFAFVGLIAYSVECSAKTIREIIKGENK